MRNKHEIARDEEIVEKIHRNTLKVLEEIGIAFHDDEALEFMASKGIKVVGNRAYFTEKQVMDALDVTTKEFIVHARNPKYDVKMNMEDLYMTPGYGSPFITKPTEQHAMVLLQTSSNLQTLCKPVKNFQSTAEFWFSQQM